VEAAAELLIGHRSWLLREDFLQVAVEAGRAKLKYRILQAGHALLRLHRLRDARPGIVVLPLIPRPS
jgi:hypothetical protein